MATEKPRISVTLDEDLSDRLERYRHTSKTSTTSKAAAELIRLALDMLESDNQEEIDIDPLEEAQFLLSTLNDLIVKLKKEKGD